MKSKGKVTGRVLVLDFDDVILPSERLIDDMIAKYWYTASDKYLRDLNSMFKKNLIETRDELEAEIEVYRDKKNQILEEVYPHLKNKIDYNSIICESNISKDTIDNVRKLISSRRYDMVIIESHYNSEEEKKCKDKLIKKRFLGTYFLPVKFFEEDYIDSLKNDTVRVRTSKAEYIKSFLDYNSVEYDFSLFTLVDNSPSNIKDWCKHGGIGIIYGPSNLYNNVFSLDPKIISVVEDRLIFNNTYDGIIKRR